MNAPKPLAVLLSPRLPVVEAARALGARALVLAPDLSDPGIRRAARAADEAVAVDWTDHPRLLRTLSDLGAPQARASVFGFAEASALAAARANEALRLPGNPHAAVAYLTDKAALRGKVNQLTRSPVRYEHCDHAAHLVAIAERVGYPCVAKPRTGSGGQDVHVLHSAADAAVLAAGLPSEPALIVEEFFAGPEYSVEAHSRDGEHTVLAITRKYTAGPPTYAETGYDLPADLDEESAAAIRELAAVTLTAAGHRWGPSQTEVILTEDGPRLIESHAHPGADDISDVLLAATGTDLAALTIGTVLGLPVPRPAPGTARYAGVRYPVLPPGRLLAVEGVDEARALDGVTRVEITVPEGGHVPETTSRVAGHGAVCGVADTPAELDALLSKALGLLRPVVVPLAPSGLGRTDGSASPEAPRRAAPEAAADTAPDASSKEEQTAA
ncbi:ATP-grasp domain-containing protein [Streptomyces sp. 7-21]|uniref:ATP-grasp domain-containing protein n=1 Tax=Streptomyces sp. 7-21 TaxID=2802283 RepID=UPI00191D14D4|nr:ATP-grasp domain-containing protein [Streptomyces sp. 7-21]MBL1068496.1 ATP-grasp domain-containing protein [Streptomyces sp. 7-21]